eukprot:5595590-Pleurochrysis_carterae.AAC.3
MWCAVQRLRDCRGRDWLQLACEGRVTSIHRSAGARFVLSVATMLTLPAVPAWRETSRQASLRQSLAGRHSEHLINVKVLALGNIETTALNKGACVCFGNIGNHVGTTALNKGASLSRLTPRPLVSV